MQGDEVHAESSPSKQAAAIRAGVFLFVVVSGCLIALIPFSKFSQSLILGHTVIGVLGVAAVLVARFSPSNHDGLALQSAPGVTGRGAMFLAATVVISGVVVTAQALFGRYVSRSWDLMHLWTGIALAVMLAYTQLLPRPKTSERRRGSAIQAIGATLLLIALCWVAGMTTRGRETIAETTSEGWTFLPSNVSTESGKPLAIERVGNSKSCGTSDCHAAIYDEWLGSAHRWSSHDEFFQEVRKVTTQVKGTRETEKCSACHDPVSLLSGHKDPTLGMAAPGVAEGDSCVVCHAVRKVDERGIGSYVLGETTPYLFEDAASGLTRSINHFLIRCYPKQHNRDFDLKIARRPESCAPCHKEYDLLDEREGPVQVETQFDDWKNGKWNTNPDGSRRLYCQQCHMGLVTASRRDADPYDLKKSWGKRHRNHAFAAANQYMPGAISSHNAKTQMEKAHEWLRGERAVPEIENVWSKGAIVEMVLAAPAAASSQNETTLVVKLTNKKVGHSFPTGPLNIARAWIEVVVNDANGKTLFHSGLLDEKFHIEDGTYVLKPLAINMAGQMILRKDLWHPVGPQFRRAILALESDTYEYKFKVPSEAQGPLMAKARLRYSKANQFFMDAVHPDQQRTAPITDVSSASAVIALKR